MFAGVSVKIRIVALARFDLKKSEAALLKVIY